MARYEQDFAPRVGWETDEHTVAFYKFEEGQGEIFKDASGNRHHGKIVRAEWVRVDVSMDAGEVDYTRQGLIDDDLRQRRVVQQLLDVGFEIKTKHALAGMQPAGLAA